MCDGSPTSVEGSNQYHVPHDRWRDQPLTRASRRDIKHPVLCVIYRFGDRGDIWGKLEEERKGEVGREERGFRKGGNETEGWEKREREREVEKEARREGRERVGEH